MSAASHPNVPYTEAQRREAAEWFVVIHDENDPNADTLQAWLRWLDVDERNRKAFEAVAQAWHNTPGSTALAMPTAEEVSEDTYDGEMSVDNWRAKSAAEGPIPASRVGGPAARRFARTYRWAGLVAASLLAITLGLITMHRFISPRDLPPDEFSTRTAEQIEITLADGSRVWLGPKSKLSVRFTKAQRGIQLTAGEAFFSVKKDPSRPFVVSSISGDITAVGTAFNVRAIDNHVTVSVSEGVVTVAPKTPSEAIKPAQVRVASGQQVTFAARESVEALSITLSPNPGERSRWRDGVLIYRNEPLRDVVMDVARYSEAELSISDDSVGDLRFSGVVYQGAVAEWASALPESFPVKILKEGNREVIAPR